MVENRIDEGFRCKCKNKIGIIQKHNLKKIPFCGIFNNYPFNLGIIVAVLLIKCLKCKL